MLGGAGFLPSTLCCIGTVGSILRGLYNFAAIAVDAGKHHPTQVQRRRHLGNSPRFHSL